MPGRRRPCSGSSKNSSADQPIAMVWRTGQIAVRRMHANPRPGLRGLSCAMRVVVAGPASSIPAAAPGLPLRPRARTGLS